MEKKEYLERLLEARDTYSDEIPKELVHSVAYVNGKPVIPRFKCRIMWFQCGLIANVELGLDASFVNEHAKRLYKDFVEYMNRTDLPERLTNHEDIRMANEILTSIISDLEGQLK